MLQAKTFVISMFFSLITVPFIKPSGGLPSTITCVRSMAYPRFIFQQPTLISDSNLGHQSGALWVSVWALRQRKKETTLHTSSQRRQNPIIAQCKFIFYRSHNSLICFWWTYFPPFSPKRLISANLNPIKTSPWNTSQYNRLQFNFRQSCMNSSSHTVSAKIETLKWWFNPALTSDSRLGFDRWQMYNLRWTKSEQMLTKVIWFKSIQMSNREFIENLEV